MKLKGEKFKLPLGSFNIITFYMVYVALVFVLVSIFIYIPAPDKVVTKDDTENTYKTEYDEVLINGASITCSSEKRKTIFKEADKIDVRYSYAEVTGDYVKNGAAESEEEEYYYEILDGMKLSFINLPNNIRATITNNHNDESYQIDSTNIVKGSFEFTTADVEEVVLYTVTVYTMDEECPNELIRQFSFNAPRLNQYHFIASCDHNDDSQCNLFLYDEDGEYAFMISSEEIDKIDKEVEKQEKEYEILQKRGNYSYPLALGITFVVVLISTIIFMIIAKIDNKRRRKLHEEI